MRNAYCLLWNSVFAGRNLRLKEEDFPCRKGLTSVILPQPLSGVFFSQSVQTLANDALEFEFGRIDKFCDGKIFGSHLIDA